MHKIISVLSLAGFIISSIKADATYQQPPTSQASQVVNDTPQTSYAPAATSYQNSDTISVCDKRITIFPQLIFGNNFHSFWTTKPMIRHSIRASCRKMLCSNTLVNTELVLRARLWRDFWFRHWNKRRLSRWRRRSWACLDLSCRARKLFWRFWPNSSPSQPQQLELSSSAALLLHSFVPSHPCAPSPS